MAATFVTSTSYIVTSQTPGISTTLTVPAPASIALGNTLITCLFNSSGTTYTNTWALADWTFTKVSDNVNQGAGNLALGVKTAVSADVGASNYAFAGTGSSSSAPWYMNAVILNYSGLGNSFTTTPSVSNTAVLSTTVDAPAVSPVATTDLLLACMGTCNGKAYSTTPAGMTTRESTNSAFAGGLIVLDQALSASGSTGIRTQTFAATDKLYGSLVTLATGPIQPTSIIKQQAVNRSYTY